MAAMVDNCLFCKIVRGEIPSKKLWEDEYCYAFADIQPQAPAHGLIIPKDHAAGLNDLADLSDAQLAACLRAAQIVANVLGIDESGYRLISNCGAHACQSVGHLHFHVLGGRQLDAKMV